MNQEDKKKENRNEFYTLPKCNCKRVNTSKSESSYLQIINWNNNSFMQRYRTMFLLMFITYRNCSKRNHIAYTVRYELDTASNKDSQIYKLEQLFENLLKLSSGHSKI